MKLQPILVISGVLLGTLGMAALFVPDDVGALFRQAGEAASPLVIQLLGTALFSLGFLNWFSRTATIGGIFGRPLLLTNWAFYFTCTATLFRHALARGNARTEWLFVAIGAALAIWFTRYLFFPPKPAA